MRSSGQQHEIISAPQRQPRQRLHPSGLLPAPPINQSHDQIAQKGSSPSQSLSPPHVDYYRNMMLEQNNLPVNTHNRAHTDFSPVVYRSNNENQDIIFSAQKQHEKGGENYH